MWSILATVELIPSRRLISKTMPSDLRAFNKKRLLDLELKIDRTSLIDFSDDCLRFASIQIVL
jgi:hypothetical protein